MMTILSYEVIAQRIEKALETKPDMTGTDMHLSLFDRESVTMQRIGVVLSRMVREGRLIRNKVKGKCTYRPAGQEQGAREGLSDAMMEKMDIYAFKPLVSAPRVAPMREIPAWSRQPL